MFFGKKDKVIEVKFDSLMQFLDSIFTSKLSDFNPKAKAISNELKRSLDEFHVACKEFEELKAEPELENIYFDNANFVKSQKDFYTKAIFKLIGNFAVSATEPDISYDGYVQLLSEFELFIQEILQTNAHFRKVIHSYSDHLNSLQKSFSNIEKYRDMLKSELKKKEHEFSKYTRLKEEIKKTMELSSKISEIDKSIIMLESNAKYRKSEEEIRKEAELRADISSANSEILSLDAEIARSYNQISNSTMPLERAARKYDHMSARKKRLYDLVTDPVHKLREESEYLEFKELLADLKKLIAENKIDVSNKEKIETNISYLLDANVHKMIKSYDELNAQRSSLKSRIAICERRLAEIKDKEDISTATIARMDALKASQEETKRKLLEEKKAIERMFSEYYSRNIEINM